MLRIEGRAAGSPLLLFTLLAALWTACEEVPETGSSASSSGASASQGGAAGAATTSSSTGGNGGAGGGEGGGGPVLPQSFLVSGVVTDGSAPVEGAIVMQGGGKPAFTTGPDGQFAITLTTEIKGMPTVVAAKVGYRAAGIEFFELPTESVELILYKAEPPDNIGYIFGNPGKGTPETDISTQYCGHCHMTLAKQFQSSAHAKATKNPLLQDLYAGVSGAYSDQMACENAGGVWRLGKVPGTASTTTSKCYWGGGVLPDLNPSCGGANSMACDDPNLPAGQGPNAFGQCADCHAAAMDGAPGGRNLLDATGLSYENGNHCDACHHVKDIDLSKAPGTAGALIFQRPKEKLDQGPLGMVRQVMYGPLPDVPLVFMGGSYQPKFSTAEYCGACHEQKQNALLPGDSIDAARWPNGLPTHSTFSEWQAGPFNTAGTHCQFCHMPPTGGLNSSIDVANPDNAGMVFGFLRTPEQIRSHIFRGPLVGTPRLINTAASLFMGVQVLPGKLFAAIAVKNTGCGHALPTGEPMRQILLLVRAEACGTALAPSGGMTIPDIGGSMAEGSVGADISQLGQELIWPAAAAQAKVGQTVRIVRPSGVFDDYEGIGYFADPMLTPAQKGMEIFEPVAQADIVAINQDKLLLNTSVLLQAGDRVYVGDSLGWPPVDGQASLALAGAAGYGFAKVLVDSNGERGVHHYRAVDIASDNRIAPQSEAMTEHAFALPQGCSNATVEAMLLYRPLSADMARGRGWNAHDYIIASVKESIALP